MEPQLIPINNIQLLTSAVTNASNTLETAVNSVQLLPAPQESTEYSGTIWKLLKDNNSFVSLTNFSETDFIGIFNEIQLSIAKFRNRGPNPKLAWEDQLLITLIFYKSGMDFGKLGSFLNLTEFSVRESVVRIREILYNSLKDKWLENRFRPTPIENTNYPHIGLLCDSTSVPVFRSRARFEEEKIYYDGKNKIYALKKEVAVMAKAPHYALFFSKAEPGSIHDYTIFKKNYNQYISYLRKTTEERDLPLLNLDTAFPNWGILLDRGYIGPATDTPELRKITLKKNVTTVMDQASNLELSQLRCPVERFFGRLKCLWKIFTSEFRLDHAHFDMDFDICCLLTNESIERKQLAVEDGDFYLKLNQYKLTITEAKEKKRKLESSKYHKEKRLKKKKQLNFHFSFIFFPFF
jgi:hypothetical protein